MALWFFQLTYIIQLHKNMLVACNLTECQYFPSWASLNLEEDITNLEYVPRGMMSDVWMY